MVFGFDWFVKKNRFCWNNCLVAMVLSQCLPLDEKIDEVYCCCFLEVPCYPPSSCLSLFLISFLICCYLCYRQKEELIKELMKSDKEKQELNLQYKERVHSMEKEIDEARKELEETKSRLDNYEKQGIDKQKVEKEYRRKLKNLEGKMAVLQRKQSEADSMREFRDNGERKRNELEGNIERLRNQYENMVKKLKIESEKKAKLEQELSKGVQKIKELEIKTDQQSKLLKRKTEDVAAAQRKLRNGSTVHDE